MCFSVSALPMWMYVTVHVPIVHEGHTEVTDHQKLQL